jgi:hypothetical protein
VTQDEAADRLLAFGEWLETIDLVLCASTRCRARVGGTNVRFRSAGLLKGVGYGTISHGVEHELD